MIDEVQAQRLVDLYADMILRISFNYLKQTYDAEDICQTVFLKYLTAAPKFENPEHEKAWIIRATVHSCKDHLKSAFYRHTAPLEEATTMAAPTVTDSSVLQALKNLSENYRISLYLFYYEEYSAEEIAQILGKRKSAVEQYLSRGRRKLRTYLSNERSTELL